MQRLRFTRPKHHILVTEANQKHPIHGGDEFSIGDDRAEALIARGLAEPVSGGKKQQPAAESKGQEAPTDNDDSKEEK